MSKVKFTIVTICFNAAKSLPLTMESVLCQDYDNFEYIIQDGGSTDSSDGIIREYKEKFLERGINFIYNSGKDGGIYDAMNLAVQSSSGQYVNFMNAGDCFYSENVMTSINASIEKSQSEGTKPVIVFGDCAEYEYDKFYLFPKCPEKIEEVMPFSHQSVFASREFLTEHPFDLSLKYSADYDFLLTASDLNVPFLDCGVIVCITTKDGLSSVNYHDMLMESAQILKNHGKYHHSEEELAKIEKTLILKQFVLDHFPTFIKKSIRSVQIKSRGQNFDVTIPKWYKEKL